MDPRVIILILMLVALVMVIAVSSAPVIDDDESELIYPITNLHRIELSSLKLQKNEVIYNLRNLIQSGYDPSKDSIFKLELWLVRGEHGKSQYKQNVASIMGSGITYELTPGILKIIIPKYIQDDYENYRLDPVLWINRVSKSQVSTKATHE